MSRQVRKLPAPYIVGALTLVLAAAVGLSTASDAEAAAKVVGSVSYLKGDAQRKAKGGKSWADLKKGTSLKEGDRLKTKRGARLEAKLHDGSLLRLGSSSELTLQDVGVNKKQPKKKKVTAKLWIGKVWASVTSLFGSESKFEVQTDNAVAGVRGTRFNAAVGEDGTTTVKVYSGKVLVSNKPIYAVKGHTKAKRVEVAGPQEVSKKKWEELVAGAMQMIQVASNGDISQPKDFELADAATDDWESWNSERDKLAGIKE